MKPGCCRAPTALPPATTATWSPPTPLACGALLKLGLWPMLRQWPMQPRCPQTPLEVLLGGAALEQQLTPCQMAAGLMGAVRGGPENLSGCRGRGTAACWGGAKSCTTLVMCRSNQTELMLLLM